MFYGIKLFNRRAFEIYKKYFTHCKPPIFGSFFVWILSLLVLKVMLNNDFRHLDYMWPVHYEWTYDINLVFWCWVYFNLDFVLGNLSWTWNHFLDLNLWELEVCYNLELYFALNFVQVFWICCRKGFFSWLGWMDGFIGIWFTLFQFIFS